MRRRTARDGAAARRRRTARGGAAATRRRTARGGSAGNRKRRTRGGATATRRRRGTAQMEVNLLEVSVSLAQEQLKRAEKELPSLDGKQKSKRVQSWEHVGRAGPGDGDEVGVRLQEEI